ncbi:MAG: carboxypeptidase regulatory-like domain-containing protein [Actinobacteria bacterium]|nr:carboxypeptidase regulatory-like domain-containing protein [Actinomycetota bacterium]
MAEAAPTGSISGTVTAKVGGQRLQGVKVCAYPAVGGGEEKFCKTTDAEGEYEIPAVPDGGYEVEFLGRPIGYVNKTYPSNVVVSGAPVTAIDAELEKGGSIKGTVTAAATGLPVSGVEACAFTADESEYGCGATGFTGAYAIEGLAPGRYEVFFSTAETESELVSQYYSGGPFNLAAGQEVTGVNAALQRGGQIAGTVRLAATGAPLKGVEVCITEASEAWELGCLKTPVSGGYRFTGLWNESFKIVFSPEAAELEGPEASENSPDAYPTQWWNAQPSFATAVPIAIAPPAIVSGIDGSLGPGPVVVTPPAPATSAPAATTVVMPKPKPKPKPLRCKRGFVKKKLKGKAVHCVKRHKPARHHRRHRP